MNDGPQPPQSSVVPFGCGIPVLKSTHVPLQFVVPIEQQRPALHDSLLLQKVSHAPQLFGSVCLFVHEPLQTSGNVPPVAAEQSWHVPD